MDWLGSPSSPADCCHCCGSSCADGLSESVNKRGGRLTRPPLFFKFNVGLAKRLLRHLTTDFAARIGCGVDVDVVLAGFQVGGLSVGQRGAAFGGARRGVRNSHSDARVLAGFGRAMEMAGGRGTGEAGIGYLPAQLLGGGVIIDIGGGGGGAG